MILFRLVASLNKNQILKLVKHTSNINMCAHAWMGTFSTHERILHVADLIFLDSFVQIDFIHQSKHDKENSQ